MIHISLLFIALATVAIIFGHIQVSKHKNFKAGWYYLGASLILTSLSWLIVFYDFQLLN